MFKQHRLPKETDRHTLARLSDAVTAVGQVGSGGQGQGTSSS